MLDAVTFVRLGNVFSSVITGNLALLGIAAGRPEAALALNAGLVIAVAGAALGTLTERAYLPVSKLHDLAVAQRPVRSFRVPSAGALRRDLSARGRA